MNIKELKKLSVKLKALSDLTRLRILNELESGPKMVKNLQPKLKVEPTLFSHHATYLSNAGMLLRKRIGKEVEYSSTILTPKLADLSKLL